MNREKNVPRKPLADMFDEKKESDFDIDISLVVHLRTTEKMFVCRLKRVGIPYE